MKTAVASGYTELHCWVFPQKASVSFIQIQLNKNIQWNLVAHQLIYSDLKELFMMYIIKTLSQGYKECI